MLNIFFSFGHTDVDLVTQLATQVQQMGCKPYQFNFDKQPGTNLIQKIRQQIEHADIVIAFLSQAGYTSPWVHQEIITAHMMGKLVVPIVEKGVPRDRALAMMDGLEVVELDPAHTETAFMDIATFLARKHVEKMETEAADLRAEVAAERAEKAAMEAKEARDILIGAILVVALLGCLAYWASHSG